MSKGKFHVAQEINAYVCVLYIHSERKNKRAAECTINIVLCQSSFFVCCRWKFALSNISLTFSSVISGLSWAEPFGVAFLLFGSGILIFNIRTKQSFRPFFCCKWVRHVCVLHLLNVQVCPLRAHV